MKRFLPSALITGLILAGLAFPTRPALAATQSATIQTNWSRYSVNEAESYAMSVGAGPLTIQVTNPSAPFAVVIINPATQSILLKQLFTPGGNSTAQVNVPQAGTYLISLTPNLVGQVTLTGTDITVSGELPAVKLTALKAYQWITQPTTVTGSVVNPTTLDQLGVGLFKGNILSALAQFAQGAQPQVDGVQAADGSAGLTIDPAKLTDGVYSVLGVGVGKTPETAGIAMRTLVVDKTPVFTDVPATQWARRWVDTLSYLGVVNGRGPGSFAPGAEVKRSEFAKMLALAMNLQPATGNDFADVPDDWSRPYIEALYQAKLVTGDVVGTNRYFYPNKSISRAEAATIIGRAQGITDGAYTGTTNFTDFSQVPTYAQHAVVLLTQRQVLTGFPDNTFRPMTTLQRDQAAKILGSLIGITQ